MIQLFAYTFPRKRKKKEKEKKRKGFREERYREKRNHNKTTCLLRYLVELESMCPLIDISKI